MGSTITKLLDKLMGRKESKILVLGLDSVGKTTILYKLKLGKVVPTIPSVGFNVETLRYKNITFTLWDLGGIRPLWKHYFPQTQAVIFVVDSSDKKGIETVKKELDQVLVEEELRNSAFLILANKQDLGVMSVAEIKAKLGLEDLKERDWYIQGTCALTGDGLYDGIEWLSKVISSRR